MNIPAILLKYYSDKKWAIQDDYNTLDWMDSSPKPTCEELLALNTPLLEIKAKEENRNRALKNGFRVEPEDFYLDFTSDNLLNSTLYLNTIREGFDQKKYDKNSMGKLKDKDGVLRELPLQRIREILFAYLEYYISIRD